MGDGDRASRTRVFKARPRYDPRFASAINYHAAYVRPFWAPTLKKLDRVGLHIFYAMRPGLYWAPGALNGRGDLPPLLAQAGQIAAVKAVPTRASAAIGSAAGDRRSRHAEGLLDRARRYPPTAAAYARYAEAAAAAIAPAWRQGRSRAAGKPRSASKGPARARNVILEFESFEAAKRVLSVSTEYQAAKALAGGRGRHAEFVLVEGV